MAGYFLYALIFLYSLPKERSQFMFVIHHFISLLIFIIFQINQPVPDRESYIVMFLLEFSSPILNLWNIAREKKWDITSTLFSLLKWSFGFNRLIGMSGWLYWYYNYIQSWTWNHIGNGMSLFLVYLASIHWYIKMIIPRPLKINNPKITV
jgi:hypothetical protein